MYTYILYFKGGTYISQVQANSLKESMSSWANNININDIQYFGKSAKSQLINQVVDDTAVLIRGLYNVWYAGFLISGVYTSCHIVKTESVPEVI